MDRELEIAGAASAGGWLRWRKKHSIEPGTPCPNCETPLQGPYCYNCGQLAENFERNVIHLLVEGVESFFHFDGRFFHTLPNLVRKPGWLTRSYLDGKRAYQIPPMRLFLVVLLLVFFVGGLGLGADKSVHANYQVKTLDQLQAEQQAKVQSKLAEQHITVGPVPSGQPPISFQLGDDDDKAAASPPTSGAASATAPPKPPTPEQAAEKRRQAAIVQWMTERFELARKNPELFSMILETWAHRFAILMLPIAALFLSILFVFQRRFYVFDHVIFSLHSLSFQGLLLTVYFLLKALTSYADILLLAAPVHLFVHMRGVYGTSVIGTLLRMFLLFIGSCVAAMMLMLGLIWVGLSILKGH
jgi:hypothetical protein